MTDTTLAHYARHGKYGVCTRCHATGGELLVNGLCRPCALTDCPTCDGKAHHDPITGERWVCPDCPMSGVHRGALMSGYPSVTGEP